MTAADRPPGPVVPTWASDAIWSSPGDPWDGLQTKTAPVAGIISQGWIPDEQPPPDRMNWLQNQLKLFGTYQDTIEVQNWDEGLAMGNSVNTTETICALEVDWFNPNPTGSEWGGGRRIFVANGNHIYSSARGTKWTVEALSGTPPTFFCMAWAPIGPAFANNVIAAGNTNVIELWTENTLAWSTVTSPLTSHTDVIWQPQMDLFLFGGWTGGTTANILALHNDGTTPTNVALTLPGGYTGHVDLSHHLLASSPTITATVLWNADGTVHVPFFWTLNSASIGTAWNLSTPTLTTESPGYAFFYDASRSLFYFITQDGHIYSTPDVVTFTDLGHTIPYVARGTPGTRGSIAVRGPIWFMATTHSELVFSTDAGQTWTQVPAPFVGDANDIQQYPMAYVFALVDRFACVARATSGGTPHQISFSRRLR